MPVYEYYCNACGVFEAACTIAERNAPHACPACGATADRVILSAPRTSVMSAGSRKAHETNERSQHQPHVCGSGCHHRHSPPKQATSGAENQAKSFPNARPWMISH